MQSVLAPVFDMAASRSWLVTANFILSVLLCLWMLRYRQLYFAAGREADVSDLIENLTEGIYRSTPDGRQISANKALVKLNGYDTEAEMLSAVGDIAKEWYVDPRRRDEFHERLMRDGQISDFVSEIYRHKSRERIWVSESARVVRDPESGKPLFYEGSVREVTETIQRLRIEERFQKLMSEVPGALFQLLMQPNQPTQVIYLSPGFSRMTGISHEDIVADAAADPAPHPPGRPPQLSDARPRTPWRACGRGRTNIASARPTASRSGFAFRPRPSATATRSRGTATSPTSRPASSTRSRSSSWPITTC